MAGNTVNKKPVTNKWSAGCTEAPFVVLDLYNHHINNKLFYHNYSFCKDLAELTNRLCVSEKITVEDTFKATICSWFYCTGRLIDYAAPEEHSFSQLNFFLQANSLSISDDTNGNIYLSIFKPQDIDPLWLKVLKDAIIVIELSLPENFDLDLKRLEDDFNLPTLWNAGEWEHFKLQQLIEAKFMTREAKILFEFALAKKVLALKSLLESLNKGNKNKSEILKPKRLIGNRRLQANIQSFLRVGFRNHIELTKMADNRAHIMISVNSILTGVLISFISYQNLAETHPKLLIPVGVFMITSLTSLIFAILCARPRIIRSIKKNSSEEIINENLASFSNFTLLSSEQYESAIDHVFNDNYLMITNLKKDLYNTGKILDTKYKFLGFSYNIFMFGFVSCVVLFMVIYLMG